VIELASSRVPLLAAISHGVLIGQPARLCDLQTELHIPLGKLVVVGAAPLLGEPIAFLVQVVEPGAPKPPAKKGG
jgi:hypothetical protein